jgi:hypothetical protein
LAGLQAKLEDDILQAQATVDSADKEKASRIDVEKAAKAPLYGLEDSVKNAKATVDAAIAAEKTAKATTLDLTEKMEKKDAEKAGLENMKLNLNISKDTYEPLKTSKVASKRTLSALTQCLADAGLEDGLVESLEETGKKEAVARGTYDSIVFKEVDAFMVQKLEELEASINAWQPAKDVLVTEKSAADAALIATVEKLTASQTALAEAEAAKKEGKAALSKAVASVSSYETDMRKAAKILEKAKVALVAFQEGPKKCYETLKILEEPAAEPEEEEKENETVVENESVETTPVA